MTAGIIPGYNGLSVDEQIENGVLFRLDGTRNGHNAEAEVLVDMDRAEQIRDDLDEVLEGQ